MSSGDPGGDWAMPVQLMSLTFLVIQLGEGRGMVY